MPAGLHLVSGNEPALRLLVVSRELAAVEGLQSMPRQWQMESASNGWEALEKVQLGSIPDLLILDLPAGDNEGLNFLRYVRRLRPELPIMVLAEAEGSPSGQEAVQFGANAYISKPLQREVVEAAIRQQMASRMEVRCLTMQHEDGAQVAIESFLAASSPAMRKLRERVQFVAQSDSPALILGEVGSGKEIVALLIHEISARSRFQFAKIDCAAMSSGLLEQELFGHEDRKHSATSQPKQGKLELCDQGTILLQEITEMPRKLQSMVLHVLETGSFTRPGNGATVQVAVRILAASTSDLRRAVTERKLVEGLYESLTQYTIYVPPLRERQDEIAALLRGFMRYLSQSYGIPPRDFSPALVDACQSHGWPGNLRQLENFVRRFLLASGERLPAMDHHPEHAPAARTRQVADSVAASQLCVPLDED